MLAPGVLEAARARVASIELRRQWEAAGALLYRAGASLEPVGWRTMRAAEAMIEEAWR